MVGSEKVEKVIRAPDELLAGWKKSTLVEVAEIIMGQSPSSQYYNYGGEGLSFFQGKAEFGELYPKPVKWCSQPNKVAQKDDVLISVRAPVGPTNLAPSECCIGRGLAAIRPRDGLPSRYVLYYLRSIESRIDKLGTGTTFKAISGGVLRAIPIPVAPTGEQDRIVAEIEKQFSRLDEAVASLKRVKANLKRYKAAVLKAAVEGKLTEDWRKQHSNVEPASKLLERVLAERRAKWAGKGKYKEPAAPNTAHLPTLPKAWAWATAAQLTPADRPCAYGVLQPGEHVEGGVHLIRVGDINDGIVNQSELKRIAPKIADRYPRTRLQGGEVVISLVGAIGRTAVIPRTLSGANTARAVGVIPLTPLVNSHWVEIWFRNPAKVAEMTAKSHEVARKTLNLEDVRDASVSLPSREEQEQIVAEVERRLSVVEELEASVDANLTRADRLRQSILKKAFSGRFAEQ